MVCRRASGSLAMQERIRWTRAGGVSMGGASGSALMTAVMMLAVLSPAKARRGDKFIQDAAEREDVAAGIGVFALELLGTHVLERSENCVFLRQTFSDRALGGRRLARELGQAEVEELNAGLSE